MRLDECVRLARKGDVLGEVFRRDVWHDWAIVIEENSNSWWATRESVPESLTYVPTLDDIVADDWKYCGTWLKDDGDFVCD